MFSNSIGSVFNRLEALEFTFQRDEPRRLIRGNCRSELFNLFNKIFNSFVSNLGHAKGAWVLVLVAGTISCQCSLPPFSEEISRR